MEPFAQFMSYMLQKYRTSCSFITDETNVIIGESISLISFPDTSFPRIEMMINKLKGNGLVDQISLNQSFRFASVGYIRRTQDETADTDMYTAIRFGTELMNILFSLHTDRQNGILPCDGFVQVDGFPEVFMEYELFPKITTVALVSEIEVELPSIYTNI